MIHPEASAQEVALFVKAATQRLAELGVPADQVQRKLAASLYTVANQLGFDKGAARRVTGPQPVTTGATNVGDAWASLPDVAKSSIINALIGGGLVGGGTMALNKATGAPQDRDQIIRNALIGGVGGAATPLLGGVLGTMGSAELDLLVGSIEKNAGALKAKKAVKAVPALKRNPTMSKRAEAFVEKVRQLLKTNAG